MLHRPLPTDAPNQERAGCLQESSGRRVIRVVVAYASTLEAHARKH